MKTFIFALICLVYVSEANGQNQWVRGSVVLRNSQVMVGDISKTPVKELILLNNAEGIKVLPSHLVDYYRFYDDEKNINRQFLSVKSSDLFGTSKFYEIVVQGKLKVVRRYHKKTDSEELNEAKDFDYFMLIGNKLVRLSRFKSQVLPSLLEEHPIEISTFLASNKLDGRSMKSAILIIRHYNQMMSLHNSFAQVN